MVAPFINAVLVCVQFSQNIDIAVIHTAAGRHAGDKG